MDTGQVLDALTRRADRRESRGFDVKSVDTVFRSVPNDIPVRHCIKGRNPWERTVVAGAVGPLLAFPGLRLERTANGGLRTSGGTARPRHKRSSQEAAIVRGMQASCHHLVLLSRVASENHDGLKKSEV